MLETLGTPDFQGVFEQVERGSNCFIEAAKRSPAICDLFADFKLLCLQFADAVLESSHDDGLRDFHDLIQELLHVALDPYQFRFERAGPIRLRSETMVPQVLKAHAGHMQDARRRGHALKQALELLLNRFAPDGFAVTLTSAFEAQVIGMKGRTPLGIAGRERRAAVTAKDEAAKRELHVQVRAIGSTRAAIEASLNFAECLDADERLVMALAK